MSAEFLKRTWFTADWHLGHNSVLKFCSDTRPYTDIEEMENTLISNYNKTVGTNDTCYFLGDFSFKGTQYAKNILDRLNGYKVLVKGNHDAGHQGSKNIGFHAVVDAVSWKVFNYYITASHYPLQGIPRERCQGYKNYQLGEEWHGEYKYTEKYLVLKNIGQDIHLHGHLHSPNRGHSERICGIQFDVGVDSNSMSPISLNQIVRLLNKENHEVSK